jgi:hypothetical protein
MKKQLRKLILKTDQVISLSKTDAAAIRGAIPPPISRKACSCNCTGW